MLLRNINMNCVMSIPGVPNLNFVSVALKRSLYFNYMYIIRLKRHLLSLSFACNTRFAAAIAETYAWEVRLVHFA